MSVSMPSVPRLWVPPDQWLAVGVAVLSVLGSAVGVKDDIWAQPPSLSGPLIPSAAELLLLLAGSVPLAMRRVAPVPVLVVCVLSSLGLQALWAASAVAPRGARRPVHGGHAVPPGGQRLGGGRRRAPTRCWALCRGLRR